MQKKWIIIVASAVLAVVLALTAVTIVLKIFEDGASEEFLSGSSVNSQEEIVSEPQITEPVVSEPEDNGIQLVVTATTC